jgi:hypothetical protein
LGTLIVTDSTRTKIVGDNNGYITYRPASVVGVDSMVWEFDWIAPADTVNEVVFYGAFNSNHEGHKGGDITQLSQLRVYKQGFTSLPIIKQNAFSVSVYPNPANTAIRISSALENFNKLEVCLCDMSGRCVWMGGDIDNHSFLDVSAFQKGIYVLEIKAGNEVAKQRLLIQ